MLDDAWARYADADDLIRLADAVERTCHEGVVARRVAEDDELRAAERLLVARELCRALDDLAHLAHAVHIDARLRRAEVHRGADKVRRRECLRDRVDEHAIAMREALLDEGREAADEVDADFLGRAVHRLSNRHVRVRLAGIGCDGNWRDGDALVDDGDAIFCLDVLTRLDEEFRRLRDLVVHVLAELVDVRVRTVAQRDAHRDGTDIELVFRNHAVCF